MRRRPSHGTQATLAHVFGLDAGSGAGELTVCRRRLRQQDVWDHQILADRGGEARRRPVRLVLSREGVFRATGGRTTTEQRVALAARADGSGLAALIHTGVAANSRATIGPSSSPFRPATSTRRMP